MSRIGIVAALPEEVRTLTRKPLAVGTLLELSDRALLTLSGVGAEPADAAGRKLLEHGAKALASWGFAAALDPELEPGSLILPDRVIAVDSTVFPVHPGWREHLADCLHRDFGTHTGPLLETQNMLTDPASKRALFECCKAIAADMESAAIAALAREAGVGFIVVRAITDSASMAIPQWLPGLIDRDGRVNSPRLIRRLVVTPRHWGTFMCLAAGLRAAQATLSGVEKSAGAHLLFRTESALQGQHQQGSGIDTGTAPIVAQ